MAVQLPKVFLTGSAGYIGGHILEQLFKVIQISSVACKHLVVSNTTRSPKNTTLLPHYEASSKSMKCSLSTLSSTSPEYLSLSSPTLPCLVLAIESSKMTNSTTFFIRRESFDSTDLMLRKTSFRPLLTREYPSHHFYRILL